MKKSLPEGATLVTDAVLKKLIAEKFDRIYYVWKTHDYNEHAVITTIWRTKQTWAGDSYLYKIKWENKSSLLTIADHHHSDDGACDFSNGRHLIFKNYWLAYGYWQRLCNGRRR